MLLSNSQKKKDLVSGGNMADNNDPVTGVFIFSKEIKNDGRIISEGKRPITHIKTEKYSGKGIVQSKQENTAIDKWYQSWWGIVIIGLFITVTGGLILYFITK